MSDPIPCDGCGKELPDSSYLLGDEHLCHECAYARGWGDADDGAAGNPDCPHCGYDMNPPEAEECLQCEGMLGNDVCDDCGEPLVTGEGSICSDCARSH